MPGTELATAYITLIPSLKGATRQIESQLSGVDTSKAGSAIGKSLGGSIGKSLDLSAIGAGLSDAGQKLADVGGKLTAGITVPLAGATAAAGTFALRTASAAETTEISFTTMLGSEEAALSMMEELADFAAHTPFELSGLQDATRQLLAYGFTAEDVIPMLTAVGDATAALGTGQAGIEAVTRALGQMQTRGKASAEEMLQLTEAGIPAWEYLARAIGTDTAGAMEAVTDGAVSADTAIAALTQGMEQDFGGMMEAQSKTVAGLMSNLSDAIEQPLMKLRETDAYEHFADALSDVVDSAGPLVESLLPHMERGIDAVAGVLDMASDAMDDFAAMGEDGQAAIINTAAAAAMAGPALKVLGTGVSAVGTAVRGASKLMQTGSDILAKLAPSAAAAASGIDGTASAATQATGAASKLTGGLGLLKGGLIGLGAIAGAGLIAWVASDLMEAAEQERLLESATRDMSAAVEAGGDAMSGFAADSDAVVQSLISINDEAEQTISDLRTQEGMLDTYTSAISRLADQSGLTAVEQEELRQAVEGYNSITGDSVEVIDAANGKLSESTSAINDNADAWRRNAEAQAYQNIATEYLEEQIRAQNELAIAQREYADAQEHLAEVNANPGMYGTDEILAAGQAVNAAREKVEELGPALESAESNFETFSIAATIAGSSLSDSLRNSVQALPAEMQEAGYNMAVSLSSGISAGSVTAESAAEYMGFAVGSIINKLPPEAQQAGMDAASMLATELSNGSISAQQAAQVLTAAVSGDISTLPPELQALGSQASGLFAGGVGSGEGDTRSAASRVAAAASTMANAGDMWGSGYHLGSQFAAGINAARLAAVNAAMSVANAVASILEFSVPDKGPWSGREKGGHTSGLHLGENFAAGMMAAVPSVRDAAAQLATAAGVPGAGDPFARRGTAPAPYARGGTTYNLTIDGASLDASPAVMDALGLLMTALDRQYNLGEVTA